MWGPWEIRGLRRPGSVSAPTWTGKREMGFLPEEPHSQGAWMQDQLLTEGDYSVSDAF